MSKKDFEAIAAAFAAVEEMLPEDERGIGQSTLRICVEAVSGAIKQNYPRFDTGKFYVASRPQESARRRETILARLGQS